MRRGFVFFIAVACLLLAFTGASASGAKRDCTWGASSMTAEYVNGQLVESQPETSGCIP
jgi:hypothetical protein